MQEGLKKISAKDVKIYKEQLEKITKQYVEFKKVCDEDNRVRAELDKIEQLENEIISIKNSTVVSRVSLSEDELKNRWEQIRGLNNIIKKSRVGINSMTDEMFPFSFIQGLISYKKLNEQIAINSNKLSNLEQYNLTEAERHGDEER